MKKILEIVSHLKAIKPSCEAMIITSEQNRLWATNFSSTAGILIVLKTGKSIFLIDGRYINTAVNHFVKDVDIEIELVESDYISALLKALAKNKVTNVGFESDFTTVAQLHHYLNVDKDQNLNFVPVDCSTWRQIKSADEIAKIQTAAEIIDKVFSDIVKFIKPGMTELEIAGKIHYLVCKHGGSESSFPPIVASGINSANPHAHPTNKKVALGETITIDMGAIYQGYCSDMTRNVALGKVSDKMQAIYNVVYNAQQIGVHCVKAGEICKEIDSEIRGYIKKHKYGEYFNHGLGHGLGIVLHEEPYLNQLCNTVLEDNMVVTVEPGIYIPDLGGIRIEDDVLVCGDQAKVLTKSTKQLVII